MNPIDWNKVREFYLDCRSYKLTAEMFGISAQTVKTRCRREKWNNLNPDAPLSEVQMNPDEPSPEVQTNPDEPSPEVQTNPDEPSPEVQMNPDEPLPEVQMNPDEPLPEVQMNPDEPSFVASPGLPTLPNLASHAVSVGKPWEALVIPREKLPDKAAYRTYITSSNTRDCLFSGIRGVDQYQRVGRDNKPAAMLAVVTDYDTLLTEAARKKCTDKLVIKPNFISTSYSGGTHAVWLLQAPIPLMPNEKMVQALLETIVRKLKLKNAYGPLDGNAFFNPAQYYHAGWDWQIVSTEPIAEAMTILWFDEAMKKSKFSQSGVQIPLPHIWEEMKRRGWDSRWDGEFALGARGCRFWDATADCPTAAIVRENGMVCFTGAFPFLSWADIFGSHFIEQYRVNTFGQALSECYVVNNSFYVCSNLHGQDGGSNPCLLSYNRQNFELLAMEKYGLSSKPEQEGGDSPIKQLMAKIISYNTLPAACPFIYRKERIIHIQGEPRLNTSFLQVHEPDLSQGHSWGDGFPWIAGFMERLFPDNIQRERFMAAWAYAYRNAYHGHPRNGHTLFIAGPVGGGKNFLTDCLFGVSMGGATDASEYILGQTRFNDHLMGMGVWTLNDTVAKGDSRERNLFAKALKKMAANHFHSCEGKFKSATGIFWHGRILVTLNTDPDSLQLLPDIEVSNRDKISLFKTSDEPMRDYDAVTKANAEMGALCSFLLNWEIPEHCVGDARWGVRNYLHPELLAEASNSSSTASFKEILTLFVQSSFDSDNRLDVLEGSATWLLQQMMLVDGIKDMLKGMVNATSIGKRLGALASTGDFPLEYKRIHNQRLWMIKRKAFMDYLNSSNQEGEVDDFFPF